MARKLRLSIVGATGLVGRELLKLVEAHHVPFDELTLFASARSAGQDIEAAGRRLVVQELTRDAFVAHTDLALCSAGRQVSHLVRDWVAGTGITVVDNSSAFRMDPEVPLVVPEVNPQDAWKHKGYIANPNCSTIQLVMALKPLHDAFGVRRVLVSTYQAVSGAGQRGMEELASQSTAIFNQAEAKAALFPHRIAFNLVPQIGPVGANGYTEEEMKVTNETRKILGIPDLPVACTAVRVPVFAGHSESVMVELCSDPEPDQVKEALGRFPGMCVLDDPARGVYPMPKDCVEREEVFVGRIRKDLSAGKSYNLWIVADNVWKGAALNAVQILELLLSR